MKRWKWRWEVFICKKTFSKSFSRQLLHADHSTAESLCLICKEDNEKRYSPSMFCPLLEPGAGTLVSVHVVNVGNFTAAWRSTAVSEWRPGYTLGVSVYLIAATLLFWILNYHSGFFCILIDQFIWNFHFCPLIFGWFAMLTMPCRFRWACSELTDTHCSFLFFSRIMSRIWWNW